MALVAGAILSSVKGLRFVIGFLIVATVISVAAMLLLYVVMTQEPRVPSHATLVLSPSGDLPEVLRSPASPGGFVGLGATKPAGGSEPVKAGTLREFKDDAERAYLVAKLRENGWNISRTAEFIDTPRSNLYKKLEQYQISQETDG